MGRLGLSARWVSEGDDFMKLFVPLFVLAACAAQAQLLKIPPSFDQLAAKADEVADVSLGPDMLGMATAFLSDKNPDEKAAKQAVGGVKGIFVRTYKFAHEGMYSDADVELLRRAYVFSAFEHRGQVRHSGEPYLIHPLAVADFLGGILHQPG